MNIVSGNSILDNWRNRYFSEVQKLKDKSEGYGDEQWETAEKLEDELEGSYQREMLSVLFHVYDGQGVKLYLPKKIKNEILSIYESVIKTWPSDVLQAVAENPKEAFYTIREGERLLNFSGETYEQAREGKLETDSYDSSFVANELAIDYLSKHSSDIYYFSDDERYNCLASDIGDFFYEIFHIVINSRTRLVYLDGALEAGDCAFDAIRIPDNELKRCFSLLSDKGVAAVITGASSLYDNDMLTDLLKENVIEAIISLPDVKFEFGKKDDWGTELIIVNKQHHNTNIKFIDLSSLNIWDDDIVSMFDEIWDSYDRRYVREIPCDDVAKNKIFDPYFYFTDILFEDDTIFLSDIAKEVKLSNDNSGKDDIDYSHEGFAKEFPSKPITGFDSFNQTFHTDISCMSRYQIDVPSVFYTVDTEVAYYAPKVSSLNPHPVSDEGVYGNNPYSSDEYGFQGEFVSRNILTDAAVLTTRTDNKCFLASIRYNKIEEYRSYIRDQYDVMRYFERPLLYPSNEYLVSILLDEQTRRQVKIHRRRFYYHSNLLTGRFFAKALMDFKVKRRNCDQIREYIEKTKNPRIADDSSKVCNIVVVGENNEQIEKAIKFDGKLNIVNCQTEREVKSQLGNLYKDFHAVVFNVTGMSDPEAELKDIVRCVNASGKKSFFVTISSEKLEGSFPKNGQYWYPFTDLALICPIFTLNDSNDQLKFSEKIVESTLSSTDNEINKRFGDVLDCIKGNPEGCRVYKEIVGSLLFPEKYDIDAYLYFNKLRSLVEDVFRKMNSLGYLDDRFIENNAVNITDSYKYLTGQVTGTKTGKVQYGKDRKSVFPPLLCNILRQLIEVGNIGSHSDGYYDEISEDEFNDYCNAQGYYEAKNSLLLLQSLALQLGTVIKYVYSGTVGKCTTKEEPVFSGERFLDEFAKSHKDGKLRNVTLLKDSNVVYASMQLLDKDVLIKTPFTVLKDNENVILENFRVNTDKESRAKYPLFAYVDKTGKKQ